MANEIEDREFDHKHCPWCGCEFDVEKDHYEDRKYCRALRIYKCHECGMLYELAPIIAGFVARVLERNERAKPLRKSVNEFFEDREKRIKKARHSQS